MLVMGRLAKIEMRAWSMRWHSENAKRIPASVPVSAAGSGTPQWALIGWPGQAGQTSAAAVSQTVKTKSMCGAPAPANSSQLFKRAKPVP